MRMAHAGWLAIVIALLMVPMNDVAAQVDAAACDAAAQSCVTTCARFRKRDPRQPVDPRLSECENFCRAHTGACDVPAATRDAQTTPANAAPTRKLRRAAAVVEEQELNNRMIAAIAKGDLRTIRRLIEDGGLDPTYIYGYELNPVSREREGRAIGLRLGQVFADGTEARSENRGLDQVLTLLLELGLDVTAKLDGRTAWGPDLKFMEKAGDRAARLRTFEIALDRGLKPNDDIGQWLFTELPQVCGRDQSAFAIRVFDLLLKYLGTSLQDDLWRASDRGPETLADVLDRMLPPGNPRSVYQRDEFAQQDQVWENCVQLSRRINQYLTEDK